MVRPGPMRPLVAAAVALVGFGCAAAIAGCGHLARLTPGRPLGIVLMEYRLRPNHVLARPGRIVVDVTNDGRLVHSLMIVRATATTTTRTTPTGPVLRTTTVVAGSGDVAPGSGTSLTVTLPDGRYPIYSGVGEDASLGAAGTITVAGPTPPGP